MTVEQAIEYLTERSMICSDVTYHAVCALAQEIERLRTQNARYREALEHYVKRHPSVCDWAAEALMEDESG